jgi:hypothetical protein
MNDGRQNIAPAAPAHQNFASAVLCAFEEQRLGAAGSRKDRGHGPRRTRSNDDNAFHRAGPGVTSERRRVSFFA